MERLVIISVLFLFPYFGKLLAQDLYGLENVTKIELKFAEENWEYPLHYYHSLKKGDRHMGHAVINGERFDSVGVRFKGFSSYRRKFNKNPLNIKLNYMLKKADYQKYETLKLSNGNLEPSWLREVLAYQIARKYMVAPQSNYAEVFVNEKYYGLFGSTESVDKEFGERYLNASEGNVIIKGNSPLGPFSGKRSSLEYLGKDTMLYATAYELRSDYGWEAFVELVKALKYNPEKIETILNVDGAIWMVAFNNVLVNLDSYSDFQQNYYLVQDDNGRFNFMLWDLNLAFDGLGRPAGVMMQHDYDPLAKKNDERFPLINLVLNNPTYRKIYFAHCRTILEENFSNGWYKVEGEKYRELISDKVKLDSNWVFPYYAFEQNFTETYVAEKINPFPYPGITELMDARVDFLLNHAEYKKSPPAIRDIKINFTPNDSSNLVVQAEIENTDKVYLYHRKKASHIFQKILLMDDGNNMDEIMGDGIFTTTISAEGKKVQYYILAENKEAAMFSPERAAHEFYTFRMKE